MKKKIALLVMVMLLVGLSMGIYAQSTNSNRLAYTSWEPRPGPDIYASGLSRTTIIDFEENTFEARGSYGLVIFGKYTVSGNTVTFISTGGNPPTFGMPTIGKLSGGRLIIGRAVFYRL